MTNHNRHLSALDRLVTHFDTALRTVFSKHHAARPYPANIVETSMSEQQRKHSAGLMRVNHTGEVCAQALYQGQAITARNKITAQQMRQSAQEENDHLAWCEQRLQELNSHTSYLNPLWYLGSLFIGIAAGIAGDRWNLGFVAETERQVVKHLDNHLQQLPQQDARSRAVVSQMCEDEAHHATVAQTAGAAELPEAIKILMSATSKLMTNTAYWI